MISKETKIFNMIQDIKTEKLVDDILVKIKEISKKNNKKDRRSHCFIVSQKVWHYISENRIPVYLRGFNLHWHNGFADALFFGELFIFEEPDSTYIQHELEERLKDVVV